MIPPRIDRAWLDPNLLGLDAQSWRSWVTIIRAAHGIELDAEEAAFFASVSGGREAPRAPVREGANPARAAAPPP